MQVVADIPDELVPRILETFKAIQPGIFVEGMSPTAAVRAVMAHWLRETLVKYAVDQAQRAGDIAVARAATSRDQAVVNAKTQVEAATEFLAAIITPPADPEPVDPAPVEPVTPTSLGRGEIKNGSDTL